MIECRQRARNSYCVDHLSCKRWRHGLVTGASHHLTRGDAENWADALASSHQLFKANRVLKLATSHWLRQSKRIRFHHMNFASALQAYAGNLHAVYTKILWKSHDEMYSATHPMSAPGQSYNKNKIFVKVIIQTIFSFTYRVTHRFMGCGCQGVVGPIALEHTHRLIQSSLHL